MNKEHEGTLLKNHFKGEGQKMQDIAARLGMTRQNLNYHLRKPVIDDDFRRLVAEKLFIELNRPPEKTVESVVDAIMKANEDLPKELLNKDIEAATKQLYGLLRMSDQTDFFSRIIVSGENNETEEVFVLTGTRVKLPTG